MFISEKMVQISVLFSDKDVENVAETVIRQGDLQIADAADIEAWAGDLKKSQDEKSSKMHERWEKVEDLFRSLKLSKQFDNVSPVKGDWDEIDHRIVEIENRFQSAIQIVGTYSKELFRLREIKNRSDNFPNLGLALQTRGSYSYLTVETGQITEKGYDQLQERMKSVLHVLLPIGTVGGIVSIIVVVLKRDAGKLQSALKESGFQPLKTEVDKTSLTLDVLNNINEKIENTGKQLRQTEDQISSLALEHQNYLSSVLLRIQRERMTGRILNYFRKTEKTYLMSGWLPENRHELFVAAIRKTTNNRCIIRETPAEKVSSVKDGNVQVPVKLKNPRFFRPFELLTKTYSLPAYKTIDPTPFLGISFLLMFGMMFGDVGQGLILALLGAFLALRMKKAGIRNAGLLVLYAGGISVIYGFLFGSFFGIEGLLPTIWVKPMDSIQTLFKAVIYFGIGMITISIVINMVNGLLTHNILGCIFDKAGLLSGLLYWSAIVVVTRTILSKTEASVPVLVPALILITGVLLFLHEPIVHLLKGKKAFPKGVTSGLMGGLVELLDIFLGFLSNTVSFIRVAAFGLAHAGLFMAIFSLSESVSNIVASTLIQIFGNIFIIALEGLIITIQALRLEFYEFFVRFFRATDSEYTPIKDRLEFK